MLDNSYDVSDAAASSTLKSFDRLAAGIHLLPATLKRLSGDKLRNCAASSSACRMFPPSRRSNAAQTLKALAQACADEQRPRRAMRFPCLCLWSGCRLQWLAPRRHPAPSDHQAVSHMVLGIVGQLPTGDLAKIGDLKRRLKDISRAST